MLFLQSLIGSEKTHSKEENLKEVSICWTYGKVVTWEGKVVASLQIPSKVPYSQNAWNAWSLIYSRVPNANIHKAINFKQN